MAYQRALVNSWSCSSWFCFYYNAEEKEMNKRFLIIFSLMMLLLTSFAFATNLTDGNVLYSSFDDSDLTSGVHPSDVSGSNNNGMNYGATTGVTGLITGEAFDFDGTNDFIEVPELFSGQSAFTFCTWSEADSVSDDLTIFDYRGNNILTYMILNDGNENNEIEVYIRDATDGANRIETTSYTTTDKLHICYTVDGTAKEMELFVNGASIATETWSGALTDLSQSSNYIGKNSADSEFYDGLLDDTFLVYDVLTLSEIQDVYNSGNGDSPVSSDLYYTYDDDDLINDGIDDLSSTGNDGNTYNADTGATGIIGQAFDFDGSDDFVVSELPQDFNYNDAFSVCVWAKRDNSGEWMEMVSTNREESPYDGWSLSWQSTNKVRFKLWESTNARASVDTTDTYTTTDWTHWCAVHDGSGGYTIYKDGSSVATTTVHSSLVNEDTTTGLPVVIGSRPSEDGAGEYGSGGAYDFKGLLDEIAIWNRDLSSSDISTMYELYTVDGVNIYNAVLPSSPLENASSFISTTNAYTGDSIAGSCYVASTNTSADVGFNYTWYVNDVSEATGQISATNTPPANESVTSFNTEGFNAGDNVTLGCVAFDVNGDSLDEVTSSALQLGDGSPSITAVTISPSSPTKTQDLGGYCHATDANDATFTINWKWFNGSTEFDSGTQGSVSNNTNTLINTLSASNTYPAEQWKFECTVTDGFYNSSATNSSASTISNVAPTITDVSISPASAGTNDNLAGYCLAADSDDSSLNVTYKWFNGSTEYSTGTYAGLVPSVNTSINTLSSSVTSQTEEWTFECAVTDGYATSAASNSSSVTIDNSAPVTNSVAISPETAYRDSTLSGNCKVDDSDHSTLTYFWNWFVDDSVDSTGNSVQTQGTLHTLNQISSGLDVGEVYKFECQAADPFENSTLTNSSSVTIVNRNPSLTSVNFGESELLFNANRTLSCTATDGDSDTITYEWYVYKNGSVFYSGNDSGNTQGVATTVFTLTDTNTTIGDEFIGSCRAYDGYAYTSYTNSSTITIVNETSGVSGGGGSGSTPTPTNTTGNETAQPEEANYGTVFEYLGGDFVWMIKNWMVIAFVFAFIGGIYMLSAKNLSDKEKIMSIFYWFFGSSIVSAVILVVTEIFKL
jgi:hypothetical protein